MVVDSRSSKQSLFQPLPGGIKLLMALAMILAAGLIPLENWPAHGLLIGMIYIGLSIAGVTTGYLLRRLALFMPMLLVFGLSAPAVRSDGAAWSWTISLWLRCTVSFLAGLWLIHVLPFRELLITLRRWRCPAVLIAMLGFMYRYTFILWDELHRLQNARAARDFGSGPWWRTWSTNSQMIGLLLLRAMERAERTHRAMLARGWDGSVRFLESDE